MMFSKDYWLFAHIKADAVLYHSSWRNHLSVMWYEEEVERKINLSNMQSKCSWQKKKMKQRQNSLCVCVWILHRATDIQEEALAGTHFSWKASQHQCPRRKQFSHKYILCIFNMCASLHRPSQTKGVPEHIREKLTWVLERTSQVANGHLCVWHLARPLNNQHILYLT